VGAQGRTFRGRIGLSLVVTEAFMRSSRLVVGLVLALVGVLWLAQGVGIIGGSPMSGSGTWAVVGAVLLVVAGAILALEVRRPTRR
jgi:hypothetical protein